jgi:hypothetical protein
MGRDTNESVLLAAGVADALGQFSFHQQICFPKIETISKLIQFFKAAYKFLLCLIRLFV